MRCKPLYGIAFALAVSGCATSALSDGNVVGQYTTAKEPATVAACIVRSTGLTKPAEQVSPGHYVALQPGVSGATEIQYDIDSSKGVTVVEIWSPVGSTRTLPAVQACL